MTGLWVWESFLSLLFSPANKDWQLQSYSPLESLFSLLTHPQIASFTWHVYISFFGFASPATLWYQLVFRKFPPAGTQPISIFSDKELVLPLLLCHLFWSFWSSDFEICSVSILSRHYPVWPWLHMSSLSHILWLRLQVSSSCVEDSLYFCFILGDNFFIEK